MERETEIYCENCKGYLRVTLPVDVNGLHKIICSKCNHIHYRCIEEGIVTEDRYSEAILQRVKFWVEEYRGKWYPRSKESSMNQTYMEVGVW